METNEKIENIRTRITTPAFSISRIPDKTRKEFMDFADKEFCSDRGMALKHIWDCYNGLITTGVEHLEVELDIVRSKVEELTTKILSLENGDEDKEKEKPKRLGKKKE